MFGGAIQKIIANRQLKPYLNKCQDVCKDSFAMLSETDQKQLTLLMKAAPELYEYFEQYAPIVLAKVKTIKSDEVLALIQLVTEYLKKKETVALVREFIHKYGNVVKSPRKVKAVGAYLKCVVSHLEDTHKAILLSSVDMLMALVSLVGDKEVVAFAKEVGQVVNKNLVKPVVREVKKGGGSCKSLKR